MKKISIATWNVNSIRARMDSVTYWLLKHKPDIVLLQETKCTDKDFPEIMLNEIGYNCLYHGQKSYNGVAILSKYKMDLEDWKIKTDLIDATEARYIEALLTIEDKVFRVASVYVPQGGSELAKGEKLENSLRFRNKLDFFDKLTARMKEISQYDEHVVIGGDYNVAFEPIDLHNPKAFEGDVGFHPHERSKLKAIYDINYTDLFRKFYPETQEYTWWDYRRNGFAGNRGWRIDHLMANEKLAKITQNCIIHRDTRAVEKPSDHVPVEMIIEI